jgi:hypothetical protein
MMNSFRASLVCTLLSGPHRRFSSMTMRTASPGLDVRRCAPGLRLQCKMSTSPPIYSDNLLGILKARELHAALAARSAELAPAKLLAVSGCVNRIQFPEQVYNGTVGGLSIACVCNPFINTRTAPTEMSPCRDAAAFGRDGENNLVPGEVVGTQGVIPVEGATVEEEADCLVAEVKRLMAEAPYTGEHPYERY